MGGIDLVVFVVISDGERAAGAQGCVALREVDGIGAIGDFWPVLCAIDGDDDVVCVRGCA